jgi:SAM-dependent methyltransferase
MKEKQKEVKQDYMKKFGVWYEDAIFRTKKVCDMMPKEEKFNNILDGAGFFPTAHVFADQYPDSQITMMNLFEDDILYDHYTNIKHVRGDVTKMDFPDNSFDMAFFGELFEHIYDLPKIFSEIKRVLKPNAMLALTTPNLAAWYNRILLLLGKCPVNYHPTPIMYNSALLEQCRKEYNDPEQREFPLHHFHIRVFTVDRLLDYLEFKNFKIEKYTVCNLSTPDRKFYMIRKILGLLLTKNAKEDIIVVARNLK